MECRSPGKLSARKAASAHKMLLILVWGLSYYRHGRRLCGHGRGCIFIHFTLLTWVGHQLSSTLHLHCFGCLGNGWVLKPGACMYASD